MQPNIIQIIKEIIMKSEHIVLPPQTVNADINGIVIPEDMFQFYQLCGGISLWINSPYRLDIVPFDTIVRANPIIVGQSYENDISFDWFIIGKAQNSQYITIDLNKNRLGKCYDSFWDRHAVVGSCSVIALNFTELIVSILKQKENFFWLENDFQSLGDAYDTDIF
ncbi:MAG: SMI1/KNR4 family protein [Cytophagales bacterium]|nr:MAG: SMI1/KNR4 family protein [Cytophagales bacterium]